MSRSMTPRSLGGRARADTFAQLAALEDAGLPAEQAFRTLADGAEGARADACRRIAGALANGRDLAGSGQRQGLFSSFDAGIVAVAAAAGSPARAYRRLAGRYEAAARRRERVRARAAMPLLVLVLALFVAPLPELLAGKLDPGGYTGRTFGVLIALAVLAAVVVALGRWLHRRSGTRWLVDSMTLRIPVLGPANQRRNVWQLLDTLALTLEAGLPAAQAAERALDSVSNRVVAADLGPGLARLGSGSSVADALGESRYVAPEVYQLLAAGESAGRLPEALARIADQERSRVDLFDDEIAAWVPRIFYFAVAGWVASGVVGSFGPSL